MPFRQELEQGIDGFLAGTYETFTPRDVPLPADLPVAGSRAARFEAAILFVDVRQSSQITEALRLQTAAKMTRAYCHGSVKIIHQNGGRVRSFNGDGMLAVFMGAEKADNAVSAALNCVWFAHHLRPRFARYFARNAAARGVALRFQIGCGVDVGDVFAVRVGIGGTNDIAWVGRPTNAAAKLSDRARHPYPTLITTQVYARLSPRQKWDGLRSMWLAPQAITIAGATRNVRRSGYYRAIG